MTDPFHTSVPGQLLRFTGVLVWLRRDEYILGRKSFFQLILAHYSSSLKKIRPELKAGIKAEAMKEHCLLLASDGSLWVLNLSQGPESAVLHIKYLQFIIVANCYYKAAMKIIL